ncbi:hypothetical protein JTB14_031310 [Gonioctena quinquepunctata]|nr:hypothetical protein JTB14_031310 [Gonioctena quinquepunctata]
MNLLLVKLVILFHFVKCSRILGFFPTPSFSHQRIFQPIWKELSLRKHEVTVITPNVLNNPSLKYLKEIDVGSAYELVKDPKVVEDVSSEKLSLVRVLNTFNVLQKVLEYEFRDENVKKLINNITEYFDIILLPAGPLMPMVYGLGAKFRAPIIAPSFSHQRIFQPIWEELSLREHEVTVITPNVLNNSSLTYLKEIDVGSAYQLVKGSNVMNIFSSEKLALISIWNYFNLAQEVLEYEFGDEEVEELVNIAERFDIILLQSNQLIPMVYGLGAKFRAPIIGELCSRSLFIL